MRPLAPWIAASTVFAASALLAAPVQDGLLDPSFGSGGKARIDLQQGWWNADLAVDLVPTTNALYVVGESYKQDRNISSITRLTRGGPVDTSFGIAGTAYFDMFDAYFDDMELRAGAVQPDGKIIAVGRATYMLKTDAVACRLLPSGDPDLSFVGSAGPVIPGCVLLSWSSNPNAVERAEDVALQADGRIVLASTTYADYPSAALVRLLDSGEIDDSFDLDGWADVGIPRQARKVIVTANQRILIGTEHVAYVSQNPCGTLDDSASSVVFERFLATGEDDLTFEPFTLDITHGWDHQNSTEIDCRVSEDSLVDMAEGPGGRVYFAIAAETSPDDFSAVVGRLTSGGLPDPGIGSPMGPPDRIFYGREISICTFCSSSHLGGFALLPDGKMLIAGQTVWPGATNGTNDAFVMRLTATGLLDTTFGDGSLFGEPGRKAVDFALTTSGSFETVVGMAQVAGKTVVAGSTRAANSPNFDIALFQLQDDRIFRHDFQDD